MKAIFDFTVYIFILTKHKIYVAYYLIKIVLKLIHRALIHDNSKYRFSEAIPMSKIAKYLINTLYGSKAYKDLTNRNYEAIKIHYKRNRHHPEYHDNDYKKMSLIDLIEMFVDWKAASKRYKNGNFDKSVEISKEKFKMSDEIIEFLKTLEI